MLCVCGELYWHSFLITKTANRRSLIIICSLIILSMPEDLESVWDVKDAFGGTETVIYD